MECRILVPCPGIKPMPLTVEVWHFNYRTTREVPGTLSQTLATFLKGGSLMAQMVKQKKSAC